MNSLKNSIVAILLLGVSYGVYQVITSPEMPATTTAEFHAATEPTVEIPPAVESMDATELAANEKIASPPTTREMASPNPQRNGNTPKTQTAKPKTNQPTPNKSNLIPEFTSSQPTPNALDRQVNPAVGAEIPGPGQFSPNQKISAATPPEKASTPNVKLVGGTTPLPALEASLQTARQLVAGGQMRQALAELSPHVHNATLQQQERDQLFQWLDLLAGKVIYSTEHHIEPLPYVILSTDTLASIAEQWKVPPQLVYNINREKIPDPFHLQAGIELKKLEGPFRAELDQTARRLTLYMGSLYAGQFNMASEPSAMPIGTFAVTEKVEAGKLQGQYMIATDNAAVCLHAPAATGRSEGCSFAESDARDLFSILTEGSEIRVIR